MAVFVLAALAVMAGGAFWILGRSNLAGEFVVRKAQEVARERLGADLVLEGVSGNPLSGFHFGRISLAYEKQPVMSADDLSVSFKLLSLLGSQPAVKSLALSGVEMDLSRATDFMKQFEGGGASRLEVNRLVVNQGLLKTRFGEIRVSKMLASIAGSRYEAEFEAETRGVPVSGKIRVVNDEKQTLLENLEVAIRKGKGSFSGPIRPALEVKGQFEALDVADGSAFWPAGGKPGDLGGLLSGQVDLTGTWEAPEISGKLKLVKGLFRRVAIDSAEAGVRYASGSLKLDGLSGKSGEGTFSGALQMVLSREVPELRGNLSAVKIPIEMFRAAFPELEGVSGSLDIPRLAFSGTASALRLQGRGESPSIGTQSDKLEKVTADFSLSESRLLSLKGSGSWMASPVRFDGTADLKKAPSVALSIRAPSISAEKLAARFSGLKALDAKGSLNAELTLAGNPKAPKIQGRIASESLSAKGENFRKCSAVFALSGETVTVSSLSALWQGGAITGSGSIGAVRSGSPTLNFSGTARGLEAGSVASRLQGAERMQVSGEGTADWKLSGSAKDLAFTVAFSSGRIETPDFRLAGLKADVKGRIQEKVEPMQLEISFSSDAAAFGKARLETLAGSVARTKEGFEVGAFSARLAGGQVKGSGRVIPGKGKEPARLDFKASATGVGLQTLSGWGGMKDPAEGKANLSLTVGGTTADPLVGVEASVSALTAGGLRLTDVSLKGTGKPTDLLFDPVSASAGSGKITATARLRPGPDSGLSLEFAAKGTDLDLKTLAAGMQADGEAPPSGKIDLALKGSFSGGQVSGSGELASKGAIRFLGTTLGDLKTPLSMEKGRISASAVTGSAYGGKLQGRLTLEGKKWQAVVGLSGADLDAYLKEQMKLEGRVTGLFALDFKGSGTLGRENSAEGSGTFKAENGEVSGFRYVKAISALYGRSSVRYRSLVAPYKVQGDRLVLADGKVEAQDNDPLYENMEFSGTVGPKKALDLDVRGRVNIQALNTLVGGVRGGVLQAGKSVQDILQGILQGATGAMSQKDIRTARGRVVGTTDSPKLTDLKVESAPQDQTVQPATGDTAVPEPSPAPAESQPSLQDQIQQEILKRIFNPSS